MLLVSKRAVFVFIGFLLALTALLMSFFLWADFDYILGRKNLAMKVGQTSISLEDLKKIRNLSGARARQLSETAFAADMFETLLLAEGARKAGLDRDPAFVKKIADFDAALKPGNDDDTVARAAFLIEELANANLTRILNRPDDSGVASLTPPIQPAKVRLHLRTILASDSAMVPEILASHASGISFADLNASCSVSLYRSVNGDIGWKSAGDLPEGVFNKLLEQPAGSLTVGFADDAGTHIFEVVARPGEDPAAAARASRELQLREAKKARLTRALIELRAGIDYWINPTLQVKCQVTPGPETETSGQKR